VSKDPLPFKLYKEEAAWWSASDYAAVLHVMAHLRPKRLLEFGPGSSTLALVEGGAESVDACEDAEEWAAIYDERLVKRFPRVVSLHRYTWAEELSIPALDALRFDLALIDGPRETPRRPVVIEYCLARCEWVLVPCENATSPGLKNDIRRIGKAAAVPVEFWETGPLAGSFALMGPTA
jgi:hypothetical protein